MGFVYGDSYGGVQSAAQASTNSDRQLLVSLLAAAQQGQALAAQRQAQMAEAQNRAQAQALDVARLQESQRQFDIGQEQKAQEGEEKAQATAANLGLNQDYLDEQKYQFDRRLEQAGQTATNMGEPLADSFGNALSARSDAFQTLQQANDSKVAADAEVQKALASGTVMFKGKQLVPKDSTDPSFVSYTADLNTKLEKVQNDYQKAVDDAKRTDRAFQMIAATAQKSGFTPDMQNGQLVHAPTGQTFNFMRAINSQPVPLGGKTAPAAFPTIPTPATTAAKPGILASIWNALRSGVTNAPVVQAYQGFMERPAAAPKSFIYDPQRGLVPSQ